MMKHWVFGGTIARHVENGDIVYGISMTNGVGSREGKQYESIQQRREAALRAANILGLTWLVEGNFPDNEMDTNIYVISYQSD